MTVSTPHWTWYAMVKLSAKLSLVVGAPRTDWVEGAE